MALFLGGLLMLNTWKKLVGTLLFALPVVLGGCSKGSGGSMGGMSGRCDSISVEPGTYKDFKMRFANEDRVYFHFDSNMLTKEERMILDRMAMWLKKYDDKKIALEGHCDSRGSDSYNLALGKRRAVRAKMYLMSKGVAKSRIRCVSFGKNNQPVPNAMDESGHALNRTCIVKLMM